MVNFLRALMLVAALFSVSSAQAGFSPLGLGVFAPVQFPPESFFITGARVDLIMGEHRAVYGFDLGLLINVTDLDLGGVQVAGLYNMNKGSANVIGLQAAGAANINLGHTRIVGVQAAVGINSNQAETTMVGVQLAILSNYSPFTNVYGVQASLYNKAHEVYGFQIGLINMADTLHGVQIGLVNFNHTGLFAVAPILNVGF